MKPLSAYISYTRPLPLPTSFPEWGATLAGYTSVLFLKWNLSDHVALSSDILSFTGNYCLCFAYSFPSLNLSLVCLPVTVYVLRPKTLNHEELYSFSGLSLWQRHIFKSRLFSRLVQFWFLLDSFETRMHVILTRSKGRFVFSPVSPCAELQATEQFPVRWVRDASGQNISNTYYSY